LAGAGGAGGGDGGVTCNTSPGKAIQFANAGIDIVSGDLGNDLPGGDVPRTVELWAKYTGAVSWNAENSVIETGSPAFGGNGVLGIDNSGYMGTTAEFGPYTNGFSDNNHGQPHGVFVMNIPQVGWVHLSWSYSKQGGTCTGGNPPDLCLSFTVNGMEYPVTRSPGAAAGTPTMKFYPGIVTLGRSLQFGGGWTGVIDEVRVWSIARTPMEVARDMKVVLKGTEQGLVAYWRLDEGTGIVADDVLKKPSHQLTTCSAQSSMSNRCNKMTNTNPNMVNWVASDIPGPFTCAP
jgi:hypothetical protein